MTRIMLPPEQAWTFARLPALLDERGIAARMVLHIGAHHGEELAIYRRCGFTSMRLVEPDPGNVAVLATRIGDDENVDLVEAAVGLTAGTAYLHRAARTVWSGLAPHPTATGEVILVPTITMGTVQGEENVLVLDTQGSELELLKAADLRHLDLVIVETTRRVGDGAAFYDDAVTYMGFAGWRVLEEWVHDGSGYTDTVFVPA